MSLNQFKQHKKKNFTTVDNAFINDTKLSWKSKGILLYLFSRPDDWQVYIADLVNKAADGEKALRAGLKELETIGYLTRFVERDEKGRFVKTIYHVFEHPEDNPYFIAKQESAENKESHPLSQNGKMDKKDPLSQKRQVDNRQVEKRHADNEALLNTNNTNKRNILNTDSTKTQKKREIFKKKFKSFKEFKEYLVSNFAGEFKTAFSKESGLGYLPDTVIEISETGYLYNAASNKFLEQDEAFKVWEYMYQKQELVLERLEKH